ncbi:hypothetical protein F4859DRAFT_516565 [Xylaria cf. heliscus]|nr:hypothetical protein F4859DRAFT_516565 [Xylaria cf. heliscus]
MELTVPQGPDIDRGPIIIGLYSAECALSLVFLILRLWARSTISATGWDDIFMIITWVLFAVLTVLVGFLGSAGGTRHLYYLTNEAAKHVTRLNWIAQPFGIIALGTGKLAVGLLLLRLIPTTTKWMRRIVWVLMSITMLTNTLSVILTFAQCRNPAALWDPDLRASTQCWDPKVQTDFSILTGSLNSAVDIIFSFIPITLIWRLHLSIRKRFGLIALLSGGTFSGVSAAIKTNQLVALTARSDLTWETFGLYLWTSIEIFVIIVCGCIPTLKPLWIRFFSGESNSHGSATESSFYKTPAHISGQEFTRLNDLSRHTEAIPANKEPNNNSSTYTGVNGQYGNLNSLHYEERLILSYPPVRYTWSGIAGLWHFSARWLR